MDFFLIVVCVVAFSVNSLSIRLFQTKIENGKAWLSAFQALFCLIAAGVFFLFGKGVAIRLDTVLYGILFGVLFFGAVLFTAKGFETGSMALTAIITNMSLLFPVLYSIFFQKESFTPFHAIGLLLFFCTFVLSAVQKDATRSGKRIWPVFVCAAFICNGATAVIQKHFVLSSGMAQTEPFMAIAYFCAAYLFAVYFLLSKRHRATRLEEPRFCAPLQLLLLALAAGAGSFGGNLLLGNLSDRVNGAVLYPCVNGGLCVLVTMASCLLFSEKLNRRKGIAILTGCCAIVMLNLSF